MKDCKCQNENGYADVIARNISAGVFGRFDMTTFISFGKDPKIISLLEIGGEAVARDELKIKFCPFCGRRLRHERRETEEKA